MLDALTYPLQGWLSVARGPFDAIPVGLTTLVVICVAGEKSSIRIPYSSSSMTDVRTSWIWPCRIDEGGTDTCAGRMSGCRL